MASRKLLFYALLAAATLGLSQFLAAWRAWRMAPGVEQGAHVLLFGLGLLAVGLWLGFLLYEVDRAAGRVRRRILFYEWMLAQRSGRRRGRPEAGERERQSAALDAHRGNCP